jgi:hypothetical protein
MSTPRLARAAIHLAFAAVLACSVNPNTRAAIIASDNAGNSPYTNNNSFIGLDGGTGFQQWSAGGSGTGIILTSGGTPFFTLIPSGAPTFLASRPLDTSLGLGDTFSVAGIRSSSYTGPSNDIFFLFANSPTEYGRLDYSGSTNGWLWSDTSSFSASTGITTPGPVTASFTRTGTNDYSFSLTDGSTTYSSGSRSLGASTAVTFFDAGVLNSHSVEFQSLQVVPEPSAHATLFIGLALAGRMVVRRRAA